MSLVDEYIVLLLLPHNIKVGPVGAMQILQGHPNSLLDSWLCKALQTWPSGQQQDRPGSVGRIFFSDFRPKKWCTLCVSFDHMAANFRQADSTLFCLSQKNASPTAIRTCMHGPNKDYYAPVQADSKYVSLLSHHDELLSMYCMRRIVSIVQQIENCKNSTK
jgi:hypothetical protein